MDQTGSKRAGTKIRTLFLMVFVLTGSMLTFTAKAAEPLEWKVFTVKRVSATQDKEMPKGKEDLRWVANSATLIYGKKDAVLIDVFFTIEQSNQLAQWISESGKNLKTIYLTHAHGDHIYGAKIIADHFPEAKVVALDSNFITREKTGNHSIR